MFQQWRIVFERSNGAVLVHAADGEDDDAVHEDGWRSCDTSGECRDDGSLRVTGKLHLIYKTDTNHGYCSRRNETSGHYQVQQHWTSIREIS